MDKIMDISENQSEQKSNQIEESGQRTKSKLRENIEAILIAIVLALFIRTFIIQAFKIPSGSMKNTLLIGDHILVNKFIYGIKLPYIKKTLVSIKDPQRGDIVVFEFPEDPDKDFIKRVIGVAGDVIEVLNKQVFVNGKPIETGPAIFLDSHIFPVKNPPRDNFGPITIPPDSLFVMGDNRDHSYDSRFWGFVTLKAVKGKAFIIYFSWDSNEWSQNKSGFKWIRWNRLGKLLE